MLTRGPAPSAEPAPVEPIRDPVLRGAVLDVLGRVDRALGLPRPAGRAGELVADAATARAELAVRLVRLAEELRRPRDADRWSATSDQLVDLLLDVRRVSDRVDAETEGCWASAFVHLGEAVASLRRASSLSALLADAPRAATALGFRRALWSAVRDGGLVPEHCADPDDPATEDRVAEVAGGGPVPLDRGLRETDMVGSRAPVLVPDAEQDPRTHPGLRRAMRWTSYVAAPVTMHDAVIGFVHADRGPSPVSQVDAEGLRLFAEALGLACERHAAVRRAEDAQRRVRQALEELDSSLDGEQLDWADGGLAPVAASGRSEIDRVLTLREREVLRLMAAGATNAAIAASLVIAEGTAKTHVKNILRKLEAGNRAEAVSLYLGGVADEDVVRRG